MANPVTLMNTRSRLNAAPSRRWFVAQSHVHAESKAAMHLDRQGFEVYLPRYRKQRRHARRIDVVAAPLFPRLWFCNNTIAYRPLGTYVAWRSVNGDPLRGPGRTGTGSWLTSPGWHANTINWRDQTRALLASRSSSY